MRVPATIEFLQLMKRSITAFLLIAVMLPANAEPGDAEAVAKARRDYALAMKGHDIGLQNAMRAELAAQLAKARERSAGKQSEGTKRQPHHGASEAG